MRTKIMILTAIVMSLNVMAQDKPKQKEIGLTFINFDSFGLSYKTGNEKSLWRFNTLFISGNKTEETADSIERKSNNFGFRLMAGKEFRKVLAKDFEMRYGLDLSFNYHNSNREVDDKSSDDRGYVDKTTIYEPGLNLVFGFNYILNDHLVIGAELLPGFSYRTGTSTQNNFYEDYEVVSDISGFSYGLSNTSVMLSISYRL